MVTIWWARFLVMAERVTRLVPWLMLFVVTVLGTKTSLEWLDERALAAVEPERSAWVRCPGRKPVGKGRSRGTWYCAPDHPDVIAAQTQQAAASGRVRARP